MPSLLHSRVGLPIVLSRFIGREREMAAVRRLLERSRLVTLTGVGGSGKTRLAIQVAGAAELPHGNDVAFIDLAPLSEPSLVPQAFAQALGMIETTRSDVAEVLVAHLADADAVLVVDNCEHVIDTSAELLDRLLTHSPNLRVLATSRQPLDIEGEAVFQVPPLAIPQLASASSPASMVDIADFDAVRLFIERASGARNDFVMDRSNADAIARICVRLDGLPLAIELAAVRLRSMSAEEILQRLDDRFSLLARRGRATIARHRTLRATIDWSMASSPTTSGVSFAGCRCSQATGPWPTSKASVPGTDWTVARSWTSMGAWWTDRSSSARRTQAAQPGFDSWRPFATTRLSDSRMPPRRMRCVVGISRTSWHWPRATTWAGWRADPTPD